LEEPDRSSSHNKPDRYADSPDRSGTNLYPGGTDVKGHSKSKRTGQCRLDWSSGNSTTGEHLRSHNPSNDNTKHRTIVGISNGLPCYGLLHIPMKKRARHDV